MSEDKGTITVVLGMHRSGTSAITRSLEVLGVNLGETFLPTDSTNAKGYWEDAACVNINEKLLSHFQSNYHEFNFKWAACTNDTVVDNIKSEAINYLTCKFKEFQLWGFKDPRVCRLLPFWINVFEVVGCDVQYVIALRNPKSIAASLLKRDGFSDEKSYFLWLQDMLAAMKGVASSRCVVVDYDLMMVDPQKQLKRVAKNLQLNMPSSTDPALDKYCSDFLDNQLRHTTFTIEQLEEDESVPQDIITLYRLLSRVARDEISIDSTEVFQAVDCLGERMKAFVPAFDYINTLEKDKKTLQEDSSYFKALLLEYDEKNKKLESKARKAEKHIAKLMRTKAETESKIVILNDTIACSRNQLASQNVQIKSLREQIETTYLTISWRITSPLRFVRHQLISNTYHFVRHCFSGCARYLWRGIPIAEMNKQRFKVALFEKTPKLFSWSLAYRVWKEEVALSNVEKNADTLVPPLEPICVQMPFKSRNIVYVTHDCHAQGAQILSLAIVKQLAMENIGIHIIALRGGELEKAFSEVGSLFVLEELGNEKLLCVLKELYLQGCKDAITSTVVSGRLLPALKSQGFRVISLVHELPGVIASMRQEENASNIAAGSDKIVFPALFVKNEFKKVVPVSPEKIVIRTQGLSRTNPYKGQNIFARNEVCQRHGIPLGTKLILAAGVIYPRKGTDLFVTIAGKVLEKKEKVALIWLGSDYESYKDLIDKKVSELGINEHIIFPGFVPDPSLYFAAASVYTLTSREDPFPSVVLESAEVGVPVVAFDKTTGAQEFILEQGGRIVTAFDTDEFSDAVYQLLKEDKALKSINHTNLSIKEYALDLIWHLNGLKRVSVIVPNYNYAHLIEKRLDSICNQSYPIYELIILDDASTDDSLETIKHYLAQKKIEASVVVNNQNSGSVFRQRAKGVALAKGDLVWIAEADDLSEPNFLEKLVSVFQDENLSMAFSQSKRINQQGDILAKNCFEYTNDVSNRWHNDYIINGISEISEVLCVKNTIPNVSAVLFKKSILALAVQNLGSTLFDYSVAGDYLVYLHVLRTGKLGFISDALNLHCCHEESVTRALDMKKHIEEILKVQRVAAKLGSPREEVLEKAEQYVSHLCSYFGVRRETLLDNASCHEREGELVNV